MIQQRRVQRQEPIGCELVPGGVHFRVWAPQRSSVEVIVQGQVGVALTREENGYFSGLLSGPNATAGLRYQLRLDGEPDLYPDPASRFQPEGPHGPSEVVDPLAYAWRDAEWRGASLPGQVIYEMHIGTFTREGTWAAAERELPELAKLGITVIEVMPVADFAGAYGWGYDGVNLFAPTRLYGRPDDFRRFVDRAHALGLAVILDVVYNHFGPDGNYLPRFADAYFSLSRQTDWGAAINYDGEHCQAVRELVARNAAYWIREFHLDGLRLDATQNIYDDSKCHIIVELTRAVRKAAGDRATIIIGENEPQDSDLVRPEKRDGYAIDALWNDDYHHSATVALTGKREAYYTDYAGTPQELISALKYGYLYQGQYYAWQKQPRGVPALDVAPERFVLFIENHDQIANSARGLRTQQLTSPGRFRALTALTLLAPGTPMLFQGQEFAASAPFFFFADHKPELAAQVFRGRNQFLSQFPSLAQPDMQKQLRDPAARETFERCKLDFGERESHAAAYALHRDLLELRRIDPVLREQRRGGIDGAVLSPQAFLVRYFGGSAGDRLMLVNLGADLRLPSVSEPLLAPLCGQRWGVLWSSDDVRYGGDGTPPLELERGLRLPAESALVLAPTPLEKR